MHQRSSDRPRLRAHGVCKRYGTTTVLDGADLQVHAGELVALVGENGAGKSTMLRICAGVLAADAGTVHASGHIGWCPQDGGLVDLLTTDEHLELFGTGLGLGRREAIARGRRVLDALGCSVAPRTLARDMSGGTRQKLNLAISVLGDPAVLLLDEPYQGFDHGTYTNFWEHCEAWRQRGMAIVVVTHLLAELSRVDRVVELRRSGGLVEQDVAHETVPAA